MFLLVVQWIALNSECSLALITKKLANPKYKSGDFYKGAIDFEYDIFAKKWPKVTHKPSLEYDQFTFTLVNIVLFTLVLNKINQPILNKVFILFIFILAYTISNSLDNKIIKKFKKNLLDKNTKIFKF
jgi:hypothetical protein